MRLTLAVTAALGLVAVGAWALRAWWAADDSVSPHWLAQHGMYHGYLKHDPDDPSRLHLLRQIARAHHDDQQ